MKPLTTSTKTFTPRTQTNPPPPETTAPPKKSWDKYRITTKTEVPPIMPSIMIKDSMICTQGDLLLVMGQKKAGKSNVLVNVLATAFMKDVDTSKTLGIRTIYTEKKVIFIDTEQSFRKTKEFIERVCRIANLSPEEEEKRLLFYNIRPCDLKERMEFLETEIFDKHKDAGLIVVDGVTDFIDSVNNEETSKELVEKFLQVMGGDCSIVAVIHEGKDGNGARGHIGQEFERKCAGAISISKDREKGIHKMRCKLIREGADFDDILFKWSEEEKGFMELDEMLVKAIADKTQETKNEELKDVLRRTFALNMVLDKKAVITGFLNYDKTIPADVKPDSRRTAANRRFKLSLELEYIIEENKEFKLNIER